MANKRLEIVLAAKDATETFFKHLDTHLTMLPAYSAFKGRWPPWPGAKGLVLGQGRVFPMAKGAVLTGPALFP